MIGWHLQVKLACSPCFICADSSFIYSSRRFIFWRLTDFLRPVADRQISDARAGYRPKADAHRNRLESIKGGKAALQFRRKQSISDSTKKLGSSRPNGDASILGCAALEQREPTTGSARFRESQFRDFGDQLHGGGTKALIRSISSSGVSVIWSALAPCLVTPRIRPLPGTVSTLTKPCAVLSAVARSRSSMPYLVTSCGMFFTLDSCSFRPTGTTSASTEVAQGTTESLTLNFMKPSNKLVHGSIPSHVCCRVGDW